MAASAGARHRARAEQCGCVANRRPCRDPAARRAELIREGSLQRLWLVLWSVPVVLLAAAAFELGLLLELWGSYEGSAPGEDVVALFAPAAAAFMTARFYTYDPYYLPSLRRYSDDSGATDFVLGMLAVAIVVGVLARLLPRVGSVATACLLPLLLITSLLASSGH